jgi:PilZ domain
MERRQHERYELEAPLSFSWNGPGGGLHRHEGLLRNMSGGGLFVSTSDWPPEGVRIRFNMSFDSFLAGSPLIIRACAQVVRVELPTPGQSRAGFAAAMKTFTLRNGKKKLIQRGTVGEGPKSSKSVKKKMLIKSRPSNLL